MKRTLLGVCTVALSLSLARWPRPNHESIDVLEKFSPETGKLDLAATMRVGSRSNAGVIVHYLESNANNQQAISDILELERADRKTWYLRQ